MDTTINSGSIHIFEAADLGKGPFRLSHVTAEGGGCQYCGTGIVYRFYIKGQDSRVFYVGSDCVMKTGDLGLMRVVELQVKKLQKELREKREAAKLAAIHDRLADPTVIATLSGKPHPSNYYAGQGKTMKDYVDYLMRYASKSTRLKYVGALVLPPKVKGKTAVSP